MAAQVAKPETKRVTTLRTKRSKDKATGKTPKQQAIIEVAKSHPELSTHQIGKLAGADHSTVSRTLAKYNIEQQHLEAFKGARADILAGLQMRILTTCTDEDIKKAPFGSRILAAVQLYDKERLERDQTTENVGIMAKVIKEIRDRRSDG